MTPSASAFRGLAAATLIAWLGGAGATTAAGAVAQFRAEADVITIELQVIGSDGEDPSGLTAAQFDIRIDGRPRTMLFATLLHEDDGRVITGLTAPRLDAAPDARCLFRNIRVRDVVHAHYRIGLEPTDVDRRKVGRVRARTLKRHLSIVRWAWRSYPRRPVPAARQQP